MVCIWVEHQPSIGKNLGGFDKAFYVRFYIGEVKILNFSQSFLENFSIRGGLTKYAAGYVYEDIPTL